MKARLSTEEREATQQIAGVFRESTVSLEPLAPTPGRRVAAVGEPALEAAELYAGLTGRSVQLATSEELRSEAFDMIVGPTSALSAAVISELYRAGVSRVPGWIIADSPALLRRQALVRASAYRLSDRTFRSAHESSTATLAFMNPLAEHALVEDQHLAMLGGAASPAQIQDVVGRGASVLSALTHCDGLDAHLGALTLCSIDRSPVDHDVGRAPSCVASDYCHRLRRPLAEATGDTALIGPERFRAQLFLWAVCWGALLEPAIVDRRWALHDRFLNSSTIGALVSGAGIVTYTPGQVHSLGEALASGRPVGEVLAEFIAEGTTDPLILFGDPDLRFLPPPPRASRARANRGEERSFAAELAFTRAHLIVSIQGAQAEGKASLQALGEEALRSAYAVERAWISGLRDPAMECALSKSLVDFQVARGPKPSHAWLTLDPEVLSRRDEERCDFCGELTTSTVYALQRAAGARRRVVRCHRCGNVADEPAEGPKIRVALKDGVLRWLGATPAPTTSVKVLLFTRVQDERAARPWPRQGEMLAPDMDLGVLPPGLHQLAVVVCEGVTFRVLSTQIHGALRPGGHLDRHLRRSYPSAASKLQPSFKVHSSEQAGPQDHEDLRASHEAANERSAMDVQKEKE